MELYLLFISILLLFTSIEAPPQIGIPCDLSVCVDECYYSFCDSSYTNLNCQDDIWYNGGNRFDPYDNNCIGTGPYPLPEFPPQNSDRDMNNDIGRGDDNHNGDNDRGGNNHDGGNGGGGNNHNGGNGGGGNNHDGSGTGAGNHGTHG